MKMTLICPYANICAYGVRSLSAYLKQHGHQVRILFLRGGIEEYRSRPDYVYVYPDEVLRQVADRCAGSDLIGISLTTNYFDRAVQLTAFLKERLAIPVIWGGIHPTIKPEEALEYADLVCLGEGEAALAELLANLSRLGRADFHRGVRNIWSRENGRVVKTPLRPWIRELDSIPRPDYALADHFILEDNLRLSRMNPALFERYLFKTKDHRPESPPAEKGEARPLYSTLIGRGCPFNCNYCANYVLRKTNPDRQGYLRRHSLDFVIAELKYMTGAYPFIKVIFFNDDDLIALLGDELATFFAVYKREINLPFIAVSSPKNISEEAIRIMADAGLVRLSMGIQTGSPRILKLYGRDSNSNRHVLQATRILAAFRRRVLCRYDLILDNPYETIEDTLLTLRLVLQLSPPFDLGMYTLVFFPGTALHDRAKQDGLIADERRDIYRKHYSCPRKDYVNLLFYLASDSYVPRRLLRLLATRPCRTLFSAAWLAPGWERLYRLRLWLNDTLGVRAKQRTDSEVTAPRPGEAAPAGAAVVRGRSGGRDR